MTVADVIAWSLLTAGSFVALVGAWLATQALWPHAVARFEEELARPVRSTLVGLLTSVPLLAIGAAAAERGKEAWLLGVLGVALLLLLLVVAVAGLHFAVAAGAVRALGG